MQGNNVWDRTHGAHADDGAVWGLASILPTAPLGPRAHADDGAPTRPLPRAQPPCCSCTARCASFSRVAHSPAEGVEMKKTSSSGIVFQPSRIVSGLYRASASSRSMY